MAQISSKDRNKRFALRLKSLPADVLTHITGFLPLSSLPRTAVTIKADGKVQLDIYWEKNEPEELSSMPNIMSETEISANMEIPANAEMPEQPHVVDADESTLTPEQIENFSKLNSKIDKMQNGTTKYIYMYVSMLAESQIQQSNILNNFGTCIKFQREQIKNQQTEIDELRQQIAELLAWKRRIVKLVGDDGDKNETATQPHPHT